MSELQWLARVPAALLLQVGPALMAEGTGALPLLRETAESVLAQPTAPTERLRGYGRALRELGLEFERLLATVDAGGEIDHGRLEIALQRYAVEAEHVNGFRYWRGQRPLEV